MYSVKGVLHTCPYPVIAWVLKKSQLEFYQNTKIPTAKIFSMTG